MASLPLFDLGLEEGVGRGVDDLRIGGGRGVAVGEVVIGNRLGRKRLEGGALERLKRRRAIELQEAVDGLRDIAASSKRDVDGHVFSTDIDTGNLKGIGAVAVGYVEVEEIGVREILCLKTRRRASDSRLAARAAVEQRRLCRVENNLGVVLQKYGLRLRKALNRNVFACERGENAVANETDR